jgi:hypothetical protein
MSTPGTFDGYTDLTPPTRYTINAHTTLDDFMTAFRMVFDTQIINDYHSVDLSSNFTSLVKEDTSVVFDVISNINEQAANSEYGAAYDFLKFLSGQVFGSEFAVDLFNNPIAVSSDWALKTELALASLNSHSSTSVTQTLFNSLLNVVPERFGMEYRSEILADSSYNPVDGIYEATITSGNVGGATLSIKIDNTANDTNGNNITGIKVFTSGSGFLLNQELTFTFTAKGEDGLDHAFNAKISHINTVQKALLNGELTILPPLELGDKFTARFRAIMAPNQKNSAGENIFSPPAHDVLLKINLV